MNLLFHVYTLSERPGTFHERGGVDCCLDREDGLSFTLRVSITVSITIIIIYN